MISTSTNKAAFPLLLQRIAVFLFMGIWTLDKFVNPTHTAGVFSNFYGIDLAAELTWVLGLVQGIILIAFLLGFMKTFSYLLVFLMHAVSTVASWKVYLAGFDGNLLFWAAIPVLAGLWIQFALRDFDRITLDDRLKKGFTGD
ncbi:MULTISPECIES: hypothetical protein [unclassified Iodidimonas]|jgi:hypothetical protein|uniref:hypothetical protein n=1 Tax=unclassified Iodidimonas TaxID=2626145 RepID=UPI002482AA0C|nr:MULTISPECIES: hypothetical protein [unclassified Iodidimonas]